MPDESYIDSFLKLNQHIIHDKKLQSMVEVIYHSMPLNCLMNKSYMQNFINRFPNAQHVVDTIDLNESVMANEKGFKVSRVANSICPNLVPI